MYQVDLNCDLGESFGNYTCGMDSDIIPYISSANVACGFHASDPCVMQTTVANAIKNKVAVGAHPGFPDLVGFGRRNMNVSAKELKAMVIYQIGALKTFCEIGKIQLQHVKPHGAMYNMAAKDHAMALTICEAIAEVDPSLILLAPGNSQMYQAAKEVGIPFAKEVFADRAYMEDGSLVPRTMAGAMITDEDLAIKRVIQMIKKGSVTTITGKEIDIECQSVCVHGDSIHAVNFVKKMNEAFAAENIQLAPLSNLL